MKNFSIVATVDAQLGIGKSGTLPWHLPADLKYFRVLTTGLPGTGKKNAVMMGRKTWESLPEKFRPLPDRCNLVLTRQEAYTVPEGVLKAKSLDAALEALSKSDGVGEIFLIGGSEVFKQAVCHAACEKIFLTHIDDEFFCDAFFPEFLPYFDEINRKGPIDDQGINLVFCEYKRKP